MMASVRKFSYENFQLKQYVISFISKHRDMDEVGLVDARFWGLIGT